MKETNKTVFINRVLGLNKKNVQGLYSFCNDERRQVLFSLDLAHGDSCLILSPKWREHNKRGYGHALNLIKKIVDEGYDLLIYRTKTETINGVVTPLYFEPLVEKRSLVAGEDGEYFALPLDGILEEEIFESGKSYFEGAKKQITVNAYERDSKARQACIDKHGYSCRICGFNFEKTYGERGKGFIHVHHIVPLSEIGERYKVDPINDLIPVCPNCHAMLHRGGHTIPYEDLLDKGVSTKEEKAPICIVRKKQ